MNLNAAVVVVCSYVGRYAASATATGHKAMHMMEFSNIMKDAISGHF